MLEPKEYKKARKQCTESPSEEIIKAVQRISWRMKQGHWNFNENDVTAFNLIVDYVESNQKKLFDEHEKMNSSLIISLHSVSKRVFIVEILEKEKGWNAISVNLETYEEAFSFFDSNRKDYSHGEIRIVQVHVC